MNLPTKGDKKNKWNKELHKWISPNINKETMSSLHKALQKIEEGMRPSLAIQTWLSRTRKLLLTNKHPDDKSPYQNKDFWEVNPEI